MLNDSKKPNFNTSVYLKRSQNTSMINTYFDPIILCLSAKLYFKMNFGYVLRKNTDFKYCQTLILKSIFTYSQPYVCDATPNSPEVRICMLI